MAKKDKKTRKMKRKGYEAELAKLEVELVKIQGWIKEKGLKIAVVFEGRDSAGKGGTIKRHSRLNVISHLLSQIHYEDLAPKPLKLPPRQNAGGYQHADFSELNFVPAKYP